MTCPKSSAVLKSLENSTKTVITRDETHKFNVLEADEIVFIKEVYVKTSNIGTYEAQSKVTSPAMVSRMHIQVNRNGSQNFGEMFDRFSEVNIEKQFAT